MDERIGSLATLLEAIRRGAAAKGSDTREAWQGRAIATVLDNVDAYLALVRAAMASGSGEDAIAAACRVSGIRKGIGDLGVFDHGRDAELIDVVDRADTLATELCVAG